MNKEKNASCGTRAWRGIGLAFLLLAVNPLGHAQTVPPLNASTTKSTSYTRGPGGQIISIHQKQEDGSIDVLFPMHGHNGSIIGAVDANGNLVESIDFDSFGAPNLPTGALQKHQFAGEYWDENAQLLYLRGRWYDPKIGRFISADPYEGRQRDPRSLNRYIYAHNDPAHNRDPSGHMTLGEVGAAASIGGVLNVGVNYQAGQGLDAIGKNFLVGAAEGVVFGGVFSVASKLLKGSQFLTFSSQLENVAILQRLGIAGKLFPGRAILAEQMTLKVGSETILLQSNAIKASGALKHLHQILGKAPTAGQTTLAETMMLQEAEAAIHMAVKEGLVDQAVSNAIQRAFVKKLDTIVVTTPGYTWEIGAEIVVQGGKRLLKIFHMQPL